LSDEDNHNYASNANLLGLWQSTETRENHIRSVEHMTITYTQTVPDEHTKTMHTQRRIWKSHTSRGAYEKHTRPEEHMKSTHTQMNSWKSHTLSGTHKIMHTGVGGRMDS